MRRQLVPGPAVPLTVIKAKTRPGIEANQLHAVVPVASYLLTEQASSQCFLFAFW